jgi:hypothetical protein
MTAYEYKVVPAPRKGVKLKGVRSAEGRFAHALELVMNEMGADGWEYLRADTLPCDERQGLTGRNTTFQNMLVFQRRIGGDVVEAVASQQVAPMPLMAPVFRPSDEAGETTAGAPRVEATVDTEGDYTAEIPGQRRGDAEVSTQ